MYQLSQNGTLDRFPGLFDRTALEAADRAAKRWESQLPRRPFPSGTLLELLVLCRVLRRGRLRDHELIGRAVELAAREVERPEFLAGLARADQAFPYHAYLVALLAEAGCRKLTFGLETASTKMLKIIDKKVKLSALPAIP